MSVEESTVEQARNVRLYPSEVEVIYWAARGKTAEETAMILSKSPHTVLSYRKAAIEKLGASNITHAVWLASQVGLLS